MNELRDIEGLTAGANCTPEVTLFSVWEPGESGLHLSELVPTPARKVRHLPNVKRAGVIRRVRSCHLDFVAARASLKIIAVRHTCPRGRLVSWRCLR